MVLTETPVQPAALFFVGFQKCSYFFLCLFEKYPELDRVVWLRHDWTSKVVHGVHDFETWGPEKMEEKDVGVLEDHSNSCRGEKRN